MPWRAHRVGECLKVPDEAELWKLSFRKKGGGWTYDPWHIGHSWETKVPLETLCTYEVATACALALRADKLICIIDGPILDENGRLINFLPLQEADMLIRQRDKQSEIVAKYVKDVDEEDLNTVGHDDTSIVHSSQNGKALHSTRAAKSSLELAAAAFVCRGGVQRVHLLDGTIGGVLLLELFKRDGMGTMVASYTVNCRDLYEGARMAMVTDLAGIKQIIQPLEESGTLVRRSDEELLKALDSFVVTEREGQIIACAALFPFFQDKCGEVACIAVSPECRGQGQGDKLLDYIEKKATSLGLDMLFLLTTRTADWFVRRGFGECTIDMIPEERRKKINLSRVELRLIENLNELATDKYLFSLS
ncbi:putative amino-acid acetyltransferase NAGS2 [Hibiscus syriacus]|uniref:Amino-acid acetyltransferase NAGS2 n=1 Tax=Hibiscus syriacus TaxID=106335 RepID=A0A6A3AXD0_HIBSY|nr:putative amino-acid acetyltransferase NAGS2 [Hibiscus syriacus]